MCTGVLWQELLHRSCFRVVTQELASRWSTCIWTPRLNSYEAPTSQVLLNSLSRRQGQPGRVHRNVAFCGDRARPTNERVVKCKFVLETGNPLRRCASVERKVKCEFSGTAHAGRTKCWWHANFLGDGVDPSHEINVERQKLRFWNLRCNPFARKEGQTAKTEERLRFWDVTKGIL